ncbi:MAG: FlgD immunoglobulin-like domain containing protein [candidate division WOR-3 bacterium]
MLLWLVLVTTVQPTTLITPPFRHTLGFNRIGRMLVSMYLGPSFRVSDPQGLCAAKMIDEDDTTTYRDDHVLTIFAVNSGTGQILYNVKLLEPKVFGSEGSGVGQFRRPHGICCTPGGDVYVADTDNNRLVRLHYADTRLSWVGVVDSGLAAPRDVAVDSRGRVYVTDTGNDRIRVYSPEGVLLASWEGELEQPSGITVIDHEAPFNIFGEEYAAVMDREGTRINQLTLSGKVIRRIDCRRLGLDTAGFSYGAVDIHGNLYVTDRVWNEIHVFDPGLRYVVSFGRNAGQSVLNSPRGIAIWRRFGQVFVAEADGGSYFWIGLDGYFIGCFPPQFASDTPGTTIAIYITEVADVEVEITDSTGTVVRRLAPPHQQRPGEVLIVWDGRDDRGSLVPEGVYTVKAIIRPTYSRPKYTLRKELTGRVVRVPG